MQHHVSPTLARNLVDIHGAVGEEWLRRLPELLDACAVEWGIALQPPFEGLSYNYVAPVTLPDGGAAVLKAGVPDAERRAETAALEAFGGHGMARLLRADAERGVLLMERLEPGSPLMALMDGDDDKATRVAAGLMRDLWRPAPADDAYFTVRRWADGLEKLRRRFDGGTGPLPEEHVRAAERVFDELIPAAPAALIHGDLHHGNILSARRAPWLAIDPKGLVGPPGYDAGNFLRSYVTDLPDPRRALTRRLDILSAELDMPREDLRRWAFAQAVLSAWWSIEDHGSGWEDTIAVAGMLLEMPPRVLS